VGVAAGASSMTGAAATSCRVYQRNKHSRALSAVAGMPPHAQKAKGGGKMPGAPRSAVSHLCGGCCCLLC
jgi:hypothetical protein